MTSGWQRREIGRPLPPPALGEWLCQRHLVDRFGKN
jgi:hypothetical protein